MLGEIIAILSELLLAAVPLAILIGFIISLVKYVKCPPENKQERKKYKLAAIIYGVVLGIMVLAFFVLMLLLAAAVAYM